MAGLSVEDVELAGVHDCFTGMGAMNAEVLGAAEPGRSVPQAAAGRASRGIRRAGSRGR